jgi:hypothetical protein
MKKERLPLAGSRSFLACDRDSGCERPICRPFPSKKRPRSRFPHPGIAPVQIRRSANGTPGRYFVKKDRFKILTERQGAISANLTP